MTIVGLDNLFAIQAFEGFDRYFKLKELVLRQYPPEV